MASEGEQKGGEQLAESLRFHRVIQRTSQEELALRAEIQHSHISVIESGEQTPRVFTFLKACGALDRSPTVLLGGIRWEPRHHSKGSFVIPKMPWDR